jgi:adenine-specific DNA-methyltransferase
LAELNDKYTGYSSIAGKNIYTRNGTAEVEELFGFRAFDFPKPTALIKELLSQGIENGDIVLDFFAGSAPTAQAVLELNKEDGGNRKFILLQMPEPCDENSEAFKAGYKTIADIAKERIRRVIQKLTSPPAPLLKERG